MEVGVGVGVSGLVFGPRSGKERATTDVPGFAFGERDEARPFGGFRRRLAVLQEGY